MNATFTDNDDDDDEIRGESLLRPYLPSFVHDEYRKTRGLNMFKK